MSKKPKKRGQGLAWNIGMSSREAHAGAEPGGFSPEVQAARRRFMRNAKKRERQGRTL